MYRRNSTKFHRPDRRKSTSSAKSVHLEYIHPETAEHDAQAAAMQAFARAKLRSAKDATLWPPPRNNDSITNSGLCSTPNRNTGGSALRRQQSVRFVRERTPRKTQNPTIAENMTPVSNTSTKRAKTARRGVASELASNASATGMAFAAKGAAGDYINALFTSEEYYTPEDDIASVPSSYRKIRKSRSMYTTSEASITSRNHIHAPTPATRDRVSQRSDEMSNADADDNQSTAGLKAPKSLSFLRGRRDQSLLFSKRRGSVPLGSSNHGSANASNDNEVQNKSQPAAFLRTKSSSVDKYLRRSMRDTSNDTLLIDTKLPKDGSLRNRARKVSHNFKHKLKNLFNLAKGETSDENTFPPQQIQASKSHITEMDDVDYMKDDEFQFGSVHDGAALSRVPSGMPSLHAVPSHQQLRSRQGSFESLRSERRASDERSRVTSWTNSDTNTLNTISSQRGEWDRQRLSIIKENGTHVSSSSKHPGISTYHTGPDTSVHSLPSLPTKPAVADSQRIYSALMKKLNDTNKYSIRSTNDEIPSVPSVPPRDSSYGYKGRGPSSTATIRHVVSDDASKISSAATIEKKPFPRAGRFKEEWNESPYNSNINLPANRRELSPSASVPTLDGAKRVADAADRSNPTPYSEESIPSVKALSTRSSAFFASPTCHLFRTRSPYRRAIQESMKSDSQSTCIKSPEFNPWMRSLTSLPIGCPSTCESEMDKKMHYAESIYSTEEPASGTWNIMAAATDKFPKSENVHGDATIFVSPPVYRPTPPPVPQKRVTSSASSVEWKTWLSANVSKLEGTPSRTDTSIVEHTIPSARPGGHVREKAQISDEDAHPSIEVYKPARPESPLATIEHNVRAASQTARPARSSISPSPLCREKENENPERAAAAAAAAAYAALRATPSTASLRDPAVSTEPTKKGVFDSLRLRSLAQKPSLNTLAGHPSPNLARKLAKRHSGFGSYGTTRTPEKAENVSPRTGAGADADVDVDGDAGAHSQSIGSKRIVDLFLSSRRRRLASGDEGSLFL
ncbi:hypothetical protein M426DRAFT_14088 [Hypoxylon sp. CI-4A]|nr:hypothetical protein M426DRAFT_14088 [Hypoxylon sp. CI-4A]